MCVTNLKRRVKGPIVAWKLLIFDRGRWTGIQDFRYQIGKLHTFANDSQAFVNREDAEQAREKAWINYAVRKVLVYDAARGIIEGMDENCSDGRRGWSARKIRVLKFCKGR